MFITKPYCSTFKTRGAAWQKTAESFADERRISIEKAPDGAGVHAHLDLLLRKHKRAGKIRPSGTEPEGEVR